LGVVRVRAGERTLATPPGWFASHESYRFPLPFLFLPSSNPVEIACLGARHNAGGAGENAPAVPEGAWYRIDQAYDHQQNIWTQPAVGVDMDTPVWHRAFLEHLKPTVEEFGVDGVHIDATMMWRWDDAGLFAALQRELPPRTMFGTEVATTPGLSFFSLNQTGGHQWSPPSSAGWQPAYTDLPWQITGAYSRFYLHLCPPRGFVPHGGSCTVDAIGHGQFASADPDDASRRLLWQQEHRIVPTMRVNYRDYGLDGHTAAFLREHIVRR
jgi:hypothetical protein